MEFKYVDVKVKRLDRRFSALTEELRVEATDKIKEHIEIMNKGTGFCPIFYNHPKPKSMEDTVNNRIEYAVGNVYAIDDDYMYCKILEDKINDIDFERDRAQALYLAAVSEGEKHIAHICRLEIKPVTFDADLL